MSQKNVYTVFRAFDPPSVGFAQLSDAAVAQNGQNSTVPTPTQILPRVTVTATMSAASLLSPIAPLFISIFGIILAYICS